MSLSDRIVVKPRLRTPETFLSALKAERELSENSETFEILDHQDQDLQSSNADTENESDDGDPMEMSGALLNRIVAMKNLQMEHSHLRALFFNELYDIELDFHKRFETLNEKRQRITCGAEDYPLETLKMQMEQQGAGSIHMLDRMRIFNTFNATRGILNPNKDLPNFWLTVLLQTPILKNMIKSQDIPALEALTDIRLRHHDDKSFTIEFHFDRNEYFSNSVLRKRYYQISSIDENEPFLYDGPEIYRAEGCVIYWKRHRNLTVDYRKRIIADGGMAQFPSNDSNAARNNSFAIFSSSAALSSSSSSSSAPSSSPGQLRRYVDSFFHFFNPPQFPIEKVVVDMELERILTIDFEIGNYLRKRVIPSAIRFYLKALSSEKSKDGRRSNA